MLTASAKRMIEAYTGYLIDKQDKEDVTEGDLPAFLAWAPLYDRDPTIYDVINEKTLTADTDFTWTTQGRIIDLRSYSTPTIWQISYRPGWDGIEPLTGADTLLYNYAPEWVEQAVSQLEETDLPLSIVEEEEVEDYRYKNAIDAALRQSAPSLMMLLDLHTRRVV